MEKLVIALALKGKNNRQIADELKMDYKFVVDTINNLSKSDIDTYNKILFARSYQEQCNDKDELFRIVTMMENGLTYLQIAIIKKTSVDDIKNRLQAFNRIKSIYYDKELYKKLSLLETNNNKDIFKIFTWLDKYKARHPEFSLDNYSGKIPKMYKNYTFLKEVIKLVLNTEEVLTDNEISRRVGLNPSYINGFFHNYGTFTLLNMTDEETRKKILEKREKNRSIVKYKYTTYLSDEKALMLSKISNQLPFWLNVIFAYQLSLKDLSRLFNVEKDVLRGFLLYELAKENKEERENLETLFNLAVYSKEKEERFKTFLSEFRKSDIPKKKLMMNELTLKKELTIRELEEFRNKVNESRGL